MIRLAKIEDMESVVEIYNQAIDAGFQTAFTARFRADERHAWFQQYLDSAFPLFVYMDQEKVAGWLSVSPYRQDRAALRYTVEISYFVDKDYQRKGIGTYLLEYALPICQKLNYKTAVAILIDRNLGSIRLLEKFGFEKWGYLPGIAEYNGVVCGQYYYGLKLK